MKPETLDRIVDNWINGNRTQAKEQAKRANFYALMQHLTNVRDWSNSNALAVVGYLKGGSCDYQTACDATAAEMYGSRRD